VLAGYYTVMEEFGHMRIEEARLGELGCVASSVGKI